jgi:hypothetical protein
LGRSDLLLPFLTMRNRYIQADEERQQLAAALQVCRVACVGRSRRDGAARLFLTRLKQELKEERDQYAKGLGVQHAALSKLT